MSRISSNSTDQAAQRAVGRLTICREGWYYLFVLGFVLTGAVLRQVNLMMVLFAMLIGPLWFSWRWVRSALRQVVVSRRLPESISAGDVLTVEITARNHRRFSGCWALLVEDVVSREGSPAEAWPTTAWFAHVPARGAGKTSYCGRLTQRGRYRFGPLRISTRFPLGLFRYVITFPFASRLSDDGLLVLPRVGRLGPRLSRLYQPSDLGQGRAPRQGLASGDFYGLRDYRPGDNRRWIHWRTSARRPTLVVRQFEQHETQDLAVIVDLWQPVQGDAAALETAADNVELAVSLAATIVADVCGRGGRALCLAVAAKEPHRAQGPASMATAQELFEMLALAQATDEDRLPSLVAQVLETLPAATRTLVIATRPADLSDHQRFAALSSDPRLRSLAERIDVIDVGRPDLEEYFVPEGC